MDNHSIATGLCRVIKAIPGLDAGFWFPGETLTTGEPSRIVITEDGKRFLVTVSEILE